HRLLGGQTVTEVRLRRPVLGPLTSTEEGRNRNGDQDGNDQNHNHQLNEGEAFLVVPTTPSKTLERKHLGRLLWVARGGWMSALHYGAERFIGPRHTRLEREA